MKQNTKLALVFVMIFSLALAIPVTSSAAKWFNFFKKDKPKSGYKSGGSSDPSDEPATEQPVPPVSGGGESAEGSPSEAVSEPAETDDQGESPRSEVRRISCISESLSVKKLGLVYRITPCDTVVMVEDKSSNTICEATLNGIEFENNIPKRPCFEVVKKVSDTNRILHQYPEAYCIGPEEVSPTFCSQSSFDVLKVSFPQIQPGDIYHEGEYPRSVVALVTIPKHPDNFFDDIRIINRIRKLLAKPIKLPFSPKQ